MTLAEWESQFIAFLAQQPDPPDAAHGLAHLRRVVASAKRIGAAEGTEMAVVVPAAWLHDCVALPKDHPDRSRASRTAADHAVAFLHEVDYPARHLDAIHHAIEAHSFSANIPPRTLEASVVQDADRLDALGAIGLARTLAVGTSLSRPLYHLADPFCTHRAPDDHTYTLDHFYTKLLTLAGTMQTDSGRAEAKRRTAFLQVFLEELRSEIGD
ncbi:MAG: HD domain-containing protein [Rhodothermales bacterium]